MGSREEGRDLLEVGNLLQSVSVSLLELEVGVVEIGGVKLPGGDGRVIVTLVRMIGDPEIHGTWWEWAGQYTRGVLKRRGSHTPLWDGRRLR